MSGKNFDVFGLKFSIPYSDYDGILKTFTVSPIKKTKLVFKATEKADVAVEAAAAD